MKGSPVTFSVFTKPWREPLGGLARRVRGLGFDAVELPVRPGFQCEPETAERDLPRAARALADEGLAVASVAGPTDERTASACGEAGVPVIRTCVRVEGGYLAACERTRRELDSLIPALERAGVAVGLQNHCGQFVANSIGLRRIFEGFDPRRVGAVWDAAHNALAGEEPEHGIDIVWSHLLMVNLKNGLRVRKTARDAPWAEWRVSWVPGREGFASWPRVAAELRRRRWRGPVCLTAEYEKGADVDALVREDLAFARSLFEDDASEA
jgi:sugar phosphate isomerase/epimerase